VQISGRLRSFGLHLCSRSAVIPTSSVASLLDHRSDQLFLLHLCQSYWTFFYLFTVHSSDDSIVFSIVAKLFHLFVVFCVSAITHELLHFA